MSKKAYNFDFLIKGGPYSHIIEANGFLFVSGMTPIDIEKGIMITDDVKKGTELAFSNIKRALEQAGSSLDRVVKATVYLRDMADFTPMNEVYQTFFPGDPPARTCIAVKEIPGGAPVEIEVIATR
ncbi:MAG: RidA family protein [Chloroflexi bacterium]|nr:RidA family protein [Chloroflexota bacterium]MBM3154006.1 RidA family protein [Chloroflexota bacterium]MBM3172766.1 RidA family protein [Chloroflexota bacterium]MBM3174908.1 RidA family protein [Chloroflexota bacterium]MBM4449687.1 RidA family protein [Chloroflexota bacterium]